MPFDTSEKAKECLGLLHLSADIVPRDLEIVTQYAIDIGVSLDEFVRRLKKICSAIECYEKMRESHQFEIHEALILWSHYSDSIGSLIFDEPPLAYPFDLERLGE